MATATANPEERSAAAGSFRAGFVAMVPLWFGAIPSGVAFGAAAHAAGMSPGAAQLMSLLVVSAGAQLAAVAPGAPQSPALLCLTAAALNAHLPLLGAAIARRQALTWRQRLPLAWTLTDGSFAVAAASGRLAPPMVAGAGVSMCLAWNVGTAIGLLGGGSLLAWQRTGVDLVVPLTFLALLAPQVRSPRALAVTAAAAAIALVGARFAPASVAVLVAGAAGALLGAWRAGDA
jgi:predicted branched-subunit amino acid permease